MTLQPQRRRLLLVSTYFPPDERAGGAEFYADAMARGLARDHGWEVTVIAAGPGRTSSLERPADHLTVHRLPYRLRVSNTPLSPRWSAHLRTVLPATRPDVVNVHLPVPGLGDLVARLARGRRPLVVSYHFGSMKKGRLAPDLAVAAYEHTVLPAVLKQATRIACTSDWVRTQFLPGIAPVGPKSCTISPAVDLDLFHPAQRRVTAPVVLYVGTLNRAYRHKRFEDLLHACALLTSGGLAPGLRLVVAGGGDGRTEYQAMAKDLGLAGAVDFLGRLSPAALAGAYRSAAVLALPSLHEAFGMVAGEAMACGLPVVAANSGGIPELVTAREGLLVPPRDPAALAAALRRILADPALAARLGTAGRAAACARLRWPRQVELMHRVLADAASRYERTPR